MLVEFDSEDTDLEREAESARKNGARRIGAAAARAASIAAKDARAKDAAARAEGRDATARAAAQDAIARIREECMDHPINSRDVELNDGSDTSSLKARVCAIAQVSGGFYIGGTVNPLRRWFGDPPTYTGPSRPMPGHCERYANMHLLAICDGSVGGRLETHLIKYAKDRFPELCLNMAMDSRGLTDGLNWIYICTVDC